jgi:predicted ATPase
VVSLRAGVLAEPVLVGRERELKELESFLKSAIEGKGKTVFVSGEAGTGKSKLALEFLNLAKKKSISVMTGWCLSDAAVPFFPFKEAFNAYFASFDEEQLAVLEPPGFKIGGAEQTVIEGSGV